MKDPTEALQKLFERLTIRQLCEHDYQPQDLTGFRLTHITTEGGEGDGAPLSKVFQLVDELTGESCLFRCTGTYNSWDESYWDSTVTVVEPFQVSVTRYRDLSKPILIQS